MQARAAPLSSWLAAPRAEEASPVARRLFKRGKSLGAASAGFATNLVLRCSDVCARRKMAQEQVEQPPRFMTGAVTTRLTVTVPAGISGGDLVRVAAPDGSYHSVMVPSGLTAGQQFSVELLAGHAEGSAVELSKLRVRSAPRHRRAAAVDAAAAAQVELEAERHLRRETQQEALRARTVRGRLPRAPFLSSPTGSSSLCSAGA